MNIRKPLFLSASLITTFVSSSLIASPAKALILFNRSSGIQEANNFWYDPVERSATSIFGFNEEQNVKLTRDIGIQESPDNINRCPNSKYSIICNDWDNTSVDKKIVTDWLHKGMTVSSHFLYISKPLTFAGRLYLEAEVFFDSKVVGFIGDPSLNVPLNDLFAPGAVNNNKPGGTLEGVGTDKRRPSIPPDIVTLTGSNSIRLNLTVNSGWEGLRVFTVKNVPPLKVEEVPEPLTILGTGLALGMGMILKRKSLKSETEN
jgi:hypothetical protein